MGFTVIWQGERKGSRQYKVSIARYFPDKWENRDQEMNEKRTRTLTLKATSISRWIQKETNNGLRLGISVGFTSPLMVSAGYLSLILAIAAPAL